MLDLCAARAVWLELLAPELPDTALDEPSLETLDFCLVWILVGWGFGL
jgi:hypothetical protein